MDQQHTTVLRDTDIKVFRAEHPVTRRVIEAIPPDRSSFRPDPFVKSALELAWHIVGAEHRFVDAVIKGGFDFTNTGKPANLVTPADIVRWNAETFEDDMSRLADVTPEQLAKPLDFRGIFTFPAVAFLRIGLNHSIHHRGQLSMYLRPMGAKVPAIYGESYDSAEAKKAGALG
jgi:uncharacterized damage-inducible protein DinB